MLGKVYRAIGVCWMPMKRVLDADNMCVGCQWLCVGCRLSCYSYTLLCIWLGNSLLLCLRRTVNVCWMPTLVLFTHTFVDLVGQYLPPLPSSSCKTCVGCQPSCYSHTLLWIWLGNIYLFCLHWVVKRVLDADPRVIHTHFCGFDWITPYSSAFVEL